MQVDWQLGVTLGIVALAAGFLARRGWATLAKRRTPGCGSCAGCPVKEGKPAPEAVVTIGLPGGPLANGRAHR